MKYSSRVFLYAPIALFLAVAAFVCLLWWHSASAAETRLAAIKGREIVPGVTLDWSRVAVGGFPFRVDAVFEGFSARGEGPHGPFRWESPYFAFHTLTYSAKRTVFEASGNQRLSWTDAAGRARNFAFRPGTLHAGAIRDAGGLTRFDLDITQLSAASLVIGRAQFHLRRGSNDSVDMVVSADGAKGDLGAFGGAARSFRLYQTLTRARAYVRLLNGEIAPPAAHKAWQASGGKAAVTRTERNGKESAMTPEQAGAIRTLLETLY